MKKCELLVPVGGQKQMIAAVENGADAVYLGGKAFNARINAVNFDDEEMKEAVGFAHKRGVKVYVTMNTLISDDEMAEAVEYAAFLRRIGVDALIIQDVGLGMCIRETMPDLPIHLSTQGSVYDLRGADAAYRMGYERVVLARELSFDEIKSICQNTEAEIEVFVHGALCICYSGQCQMSRHFGGRSGNRGQCAQPCRLPYKSLEQKGKLVDTCKYPLSPKDLCTIDHIGELAEAGVASLKIEGRMKSPEYVAVVTSIYRKYLDKYYEDGHYSVSFEDRKALEQIFNRGGFTEGYYFENPGMDLMSGNIPKHRGIKIGKVVKPVQGGCLIDVKLYEPLEIGDGVEIQGRNVTGNVVTYYKELKGGLTRIGDIKGSVAHGDPLYKITSKAQLSEARKSFENKTFREGKFIRKTPVAMEFSAEETLLKLVVSCGLLDEPIVCEHAIAGIPEAETGGMDLSRIVKALGKTGNTPFEAADIKISGEVKWNIPVSLINNLRREALNMLEEALSAGRDELYGGFFSDFFAEEEKREGILEFYFYDWESFVSYQMPEELRKLNINKAALVPLVEYEEHFDEIEAGRTIIPYVTSIGKGRENAYIEEHFESIVSHVKDTGVYVGNLSWIAPFRCAGVPVYGDSGLNVYNKYSESAYGMLGVKFCAKSLEADDEQLGAFPLMISEHEPEGDLLIDRKKEKLSLLKRTFSDQIILTKEAEDVSENRVKNACAKGDRIVRIYLK